MKILALEAIKRLAIVVTFSVTACTAEQRAFYPHSSARDQPSRRMSSCGYQIGFSLGSSTITDQAHNLIQDAAAEARRRKTHDVTISAQLGVGEPDLQDARVRATAAEWEKLGFPGNSISIGHSYDVPPSVPTSYLFICDRLDERTLQNIPPDDPSRLITYEIGADRLRIPLRFLDPFVWRDQPIGPVMQSNLLLYFRWPGLQDRLSARNINCATTDSTCSSWIRVDASDGLLRSIGFRELADKQDLIAIKGELYGAKFFAYGNWPNRVEAVFEGHDDRDQKVIGSCSWFGINEPTPHGWKPTLAGVKTLLKGPGSCQVRYALSPTLGASVTFSNSNMAQWKAIRIGLVSLFAEFERPAT